MPALGAAGHSRSRQYLAGIAIVLGCIAAGCLVGAGARWWIGGLNGQRAQLHECVVASQRAHANEGAGKMLAYLQAEVPPCMNAAGYTAALDNRDCGRALWQGDAYCYIPESRVGRLLFRIMTSI